MKGRIKLTAKEWLAVLLFSGTTVACIMGVMYVVTKFFYFVARLPH